MQKILIISFIILVVIIGGIITMQYIKNNDIKNKCEVFTGGSFNIFFNTNNNQEINNMTVCIGCAPETYKDLPIPSSEGYSFEGWYYDEDLTKKVEVTNSMEITPIVKKNKKGCMIGHEDINLYAKWNKIEKK